MTNIEQKELWAMQCKVCGYVTTLVEAEHQRMKYCGNCKNPFISGSWKSIYRVKEK